MKKVYRICSIKQIDICIPDAGYYARGNDWHSHTVLCIELDYGKDFDTEEEATNFLLGRDWGGAEYTIISVYVNNFTPQE